MNDRTVNKLSGGYSCQVCGYPELQYPPRDSDGIASLEICPSCGYQPGYDDDCLGRSTDEARAIWIDSGRKWWSTRPRPEG